MTTEIQPAPAKQSHRADLIKAILGAEAAVRRKGGPEIVKRFAGPGGAANYGVENPTGGPDEKPYWVWMNPRDGTTYGQRYPTEAKAKDAWEGHVRRSTEAFSKELETMTDAQIVSQFDYWCADPLKPSFQYLKPKHTGVYLQARRLGQIIQRSPAQFEYKRDADGPRKRGCFFASLDHAKAGIEQQIKAAAPQPGRP